MISKIFLTGQAFKQTCQYVCQDITRSEILYTEGVRDQDHRLMATDFEAQHQFTPQKEKPVFHGMLSFYPGEDPGDDKLVTIARQYLDEIGMGNTQRAIVKHTDKAHLHLHIIANRVDNYGEIIGKGLIIERGIKAAQKLTLEHDLIPEQGKNLRLTHLDALREPDALRYRLYLTIGEHLPNCHRIEDLEKRLLKEGITTRYKCDPDTGERVGISFRIDSMSFKGSQVDPTFSFGSLQETLRLQEEERLRQEPALKEEERLHQSHRVRLHL